MNDNTEALPPLERAIDDYLDGYVLEGDEGGYTPNEHEKLIVKDAIMGLLEEPEFRAALAQRQQVPERTDVAQEAPEWMRSFYSMESAPLDGTLVRLLVRFDNNEIEDTGEPTVTIGSHNDGEWNFVGWCWHTDEWARGSGDILGWLPLQPVALTAAPSAQAEPNADLRAEVDKLSAELKLCGKENCMGRRVKGVTQWVTEQAKDAAVAAVRAEVEGLRADAERYRWLRDDAGAPSTYSAAWWNLESAAEFDAAIDAAKADKEGA